MHYPEDKNYTIKPLEVTHLAGRDPVTGRVVNFELEFYKRVFQLTNKLNEYFRWQKALVAVSSTNFIG